MVHTSRRVRTLLPRTVTVTAHLGFDEALEVIQAFADSDVSGRYFSQFQVDKLKWCVTKLEEKLIEFSELVHILPHIK